MANPDSQRGGDAMTDEEGDQHRATQVQSQPTVDTAVSIGSSHPLATCDSTQKRASAALPASPPAIHSSLPLVTVVVDDARMSLSANASLTTQSIEAQLVGLRYVDKARVARDVLGLIRNSNSLLIKIQPFGQQATHTGEDQGVEWRASREGGERRDGGGKALQAHLLFVSALCSCPVQSTPTAPPRRFCV